MADYAIDSTPSFREFAMFKLAHFAKKRSQRASSKGIRVNAVLNATIRIVLHLAGFGLLTTAGFQWNMIAGLVVAGISCFVLSKLLTNDGPTDETEVRRAPDLRTGR